MGNTQATRTQNNISYFSMTYYYAMMYELFIELSSEFLSYETGDRFAVYKHQYRDRLL